MSVQEIQYAASGYDGTFVHDPSLGLTGIGTGSPNTILEVRLDDYGNIGPMLLLNNISGGLGAGGAIQFNSTGSGASPNGQIQASDDGDYSANLLLLTKTPGSPLNTLAERMRIASGGNVGIGTAAPTYLLHVNGAASVGQLTAGSPSVASQAIVAASAGAFDDLTDDSAFTGLLGPDATSFWDVQEYYFPAGSFLREAAVVGAAVCPSTSTDEEGDAVIGIVVNKGTGDCAGGSFFSVGAADLASVWGLNPSARDYVAEDPGDSYACSVCGMAIDVSIASADSVAAGIIATINWKVSGGPTAHLTIAFDVQVISYFFPTSWTYGLRVEDAAATVGVRLGANPTAFENTDSQPVEFHSGASGYLSHVYADAAGGLVLWPNVTNISTSSNTLIADSAGNASINEGLSVSGGISSGSGPSGTFTSEDGYVVTVAGGVIVGIAPP